jgi:hypothetical protein
MRSIVLVAILGLASAALAGKPASKSERRLHRYALIHHGRERETWQVDQLKAVPGVVVVDQRSPRSVVVRAPSKRSLRSFAEQHGWKIVGERATRRMWKAIARSAEELFGDRR